MSVLVFIISWIAVILCTIIVLVVIKVKERRKTISLYSCAEAQLDAKNAQKNAHRRMRTDANKILFGVLEHVHSAANNGKCECLVNIQVIEKKYNFNPSETKNRRNAVKDSLRNKGFCIVPDIGSTHKEDTIHISWQTSRADKGDSNGKNTEMA